MKTDNLLLAGAVLAGVTVTTEVSAASMVVESSFVNAFESDSFNTVSFDFDPFSGSAGALTGVTFSLDSNIVPGTPFASTTLFIRHDGGTIVSSTGVNSGSVAWDFERDLFDAGMVASDFVAGPVAFTAGIDVEEGSSTGIWFAGEDPTGGGGGGGGITAPADFGSVTLTYF